VQHSESDLLDSSDQLLASKEQTEGHEKLSVYNQWCFDDTVSTLLVELDVAEFTDTLP